MNKTCGEDINDIIQLFWEAKYLLEMCLLRNKKHILLQATVEKWKQTMICIIRRVQIQLFKRNMPTF